MSLHPSPIKTFQFINEPTISDKWLAFYNSRIDSYRAWFATTDQLQHPSKNECEIAITEYMPELLPTWFRLLEITQASEQDAKLLSFFCPAPFFSGCSQAAWTNSTPVLIRNYDFAPHLCEGRFLMSSWNGTKVIASTDCLWGALDGMNEHGLAVSLAFGGSDYTGEGFGIPLVLRYILEFCKTTFEAVAVLKRVPIHAAYNITVLDANFQFRTVEVNPITGVRVTQIPLATNHQGDFELCNYAMISQSLERKKVLSDAINNPLMTVDAFINLFSYAPLHAADYHDGVGTLYTAIYNTQLKAMEFRWPLGVNCYQSFSNFVEDELRIHY